MFLKTPGFLALTLLFALTGCASTQEGGDFSEETSQITFQQMKAAPDSFRGQTVIFGGEVLTAKRMKDGTRIEVLQLPLDRAGRPGYDLMQSEGRFLALHKEFLDPATLPYGTRVTVTGELTGTLTLPLDETQYTYPVVDARRLQVWPTVESAPSMRPYPGPSPYWGPYWGPWRAWPY